jgi:hypothetical protein
MLDFKMAPAALAQALRTPDEKAIPKAGLIPVVLGTALGAGAAWVGFSTGSREKGTLGAIGYVVGAAGALSALVGLTTLVLLGVAAAALQKEPVKLEPAPGEWVNSGYA